MDKVNPSSEIVKGNYVDLTLYVTDDDFLSLCGTTSYDKNNFSVTTPGDSSFLAGSGAGAEIEKWTVGSTDKGMVIKLTGVYYVGGNDNTLKLIITQGNYNAIVTCKIDNATIVPEKENDKNRMRRLPQRSPMSSSAAIATARATWWPVRPAISP